MMKNDVNKTVSTGANLESGAATANGSITATTIPRKGLSCDCIGKIKLIKRVNHLKGRAPI